MVDAGRLALAGAPEPLVYGADLALLVTRTDLVALSGARSWADTLRGGFEQQGAGSSVALLTVGEGRPYRAREVAKVLQLPVLASLAWAEEAAAVFSHGAPSPGGFDRGALLRSLHSAGDAARASIARVDAHVTGAEPLPGAVKVGGWPRRAGRTA